MGQPDGHLQEACGVVGVFSPGEDVAQTAYFGLYALQHRGQESVGFASGDGHEIKSHTTMGLVSTFSPEDLERLTGHIAIGHTRYSTTGSSHLRNAQPLVSKGPVVELAIAHNGNVVNAIELRDELQEWGVDLTTSSDSEIIAHYLTNVPATSWEERFSALMRRVRGAYSLTILTKDTLFGVRDPLGVRPLCIGKLNGGWVIASETCALDQVGAEFVREVEPGEAVMIDEKGLRSVYKRHVNGRGPAPCIFEHIYFARPDSVLENKLVYKSRLAMGAELAREHPVDADVVIGVPDTALAGAVGYSQESGIPYGDGLVKNRYVGRTFIIPDQRLREVGVRSKYNPLNEMVRGKRLVVIDDSIVRATTTLPVVALLRKAGAKEVHLRICAPPITHPCQLGVDMASRKELIAANMSVEEIRQYVDSDSLGYLSHEGLLKAVGTTQNATCMACFTGNHPIPVQLEMDKLALEV